MVTKYIAITVSMVAEGTKDSWLHVVVPWMPWLKAVHQFRFKTLNNTSSLGLGGTKI